MKKCSPEADANTHDNVIVSKNTKYSATNLIAKYLMRRFIDTTREAISTIAFSEVLEVGCGEGILLRKLGQMGRYHRLCAIDIDADEVRAAKQNVPYVHLSIASAYALPFRSSQFDLVMCCEVLEHLRSPREAAEEIKRAGSQYFLFSVPDEPLWRILNVLRGAYVTSLGNPPAHVNHWNRSSLLRFLSRHYEVLRVFRPLPWIVVLCRKPGISGARG